MSSPVAQTPQYNLPAVQVNKPARRLKAGPDLAETAVKEKPASWTSTLRDKLPMYGYILTSCLHALAGITNIKNFLPKKAKEFLDVNTVRLSKGVTSVNYFFLGIEALMKNRVLDFVARILDPIAVPWMNLEDIHLARGLSAGMTQIDNSQVDLVKKYQKGEGLMANLNAHVKAFGHMLKENLTGGFRQHFDVFFGGKKDKGHSMALSGYLITTGSLIGVLFGANKRNIWNKVGGVLRNVGGFFGDFTMMKYPEINNKISGAFYSVNAVIDALQRFLPKDIIDTVNHFNMILNNIGTYYFGQISRAKTDNKFTSYSDADKPAQQDEVIDADYKVVDPKDVKNPEDIVDLDAQKQQGQKAQSPQADEDVIDVGYKILDADGKTIKDVDPEIIGKDSDFNPKDEIWEEQFRNAA